MRDAREKTGSVLPRAYLLLLAFAAATLFDGRAWQLIERVGSFRDGPLSVELFPEQKREPDIELAPMILTADVRPPPNDTHLTRPEGSLEPFFDHLFALEDGSRDKVRVLFFGTSEIGHDQVTSQMRRNLQERFGDGGKGFVLIDRTWSILDHRDIAWTYDDYAWQGDAIRGGERSDGRYGLGGILHDQLKGTEVVWGTVDEDYGIEEGFNPFPAGTAWSSAEVLFQVHPEGGEFELYLDGELLEKVDTSFEEIADAKVHYDFEDGPHSLRMVASDENVRAYGAIFERDQGIVLDALMVIGAWADNLNAFEPEHLKAQVAAREPSLLILQYGAKEVLRSPEQSEEQIEQFIVDYTSGIARARAGAPDAGCLVLSPKDQAVMNAGRIETPSGLPKIVEASRQVAANTGCAFYDLYQALGGEGTIRRWYHQTPRFVMGDYKHLTLEGSVRVGDTLSELLFEELDLYREYRQRDREAKTVEALEVASASTRQHEAFWDELAVDPLEPVQPCEEADLDALDCRDPATYVRSNERGHPLWSPQIEGLGGAYLGFDSTHNYSFIAKARSEWAWLVDWDPILLRVHRILHAVIGAKETSRELAAAFRPEQLEETVELIGTHCTENGHEDCDVLKQTAIELGPTLALSFRRALRPRPLFPEWGWLHAPGEYEYIRQLIMGGRIRVLPAQLDGENTFAAIGQSAKAMGVPIRVLYISNRENYWTSLPRRARENLRGLPFDDDTLVLRTLGKRWNAKSGFSKWHYNAHAGLDYQSRLNDQAFVRPRDLMPERKMVTPYSSVLGLDEERLAIAIEKGQAKL